MPTPGTSSPSDRILHLIDAALDLQQAGKPDRALEFLQEAQVQAPDYALVHLLMGLAYRDVGQVEEAVNSLRRAVELDPQQPEALQSLGLLLVTQGRPQEAIKWLRQHAELQPEDAVTLRALGIALARLGRPEEGIHLLAKAWHETQSAQVGIVYGRYLIRIQKWAEAEEVLRQVAEAASEPKPLVEWAYALVLLERYQEALQVLQRIVDMAPDFDRAWRGISTCYTNLGQFNEALEAAKHALAIDDRHARNWLAKANALMGLEHYAEVLEAARTGIECVPPQDPEARPVLHELHMRQVEALFQLKPADEVLNHLEELRHEFPAEERFVQIQVSVLRDLGRGEDALRVLDEACQENTALRESLAPLRYEILHLLGRPDEAWDFIQPMVESRKERLQVLGDIGTSLYAGGAVEAARTVFEQLHSVAPDVARFACNLGFILTGEGRLLEAEANLLRALEATDSEDIRALVLANLGYLYLIQHNFARSDESLCQAVYLATEEERAIVRIAYWQAGEVLPDFVPHPTRWLPVKTAAEANRVTLALAQGEPEEAENLAHQMAREAPDEPWGYAMLGWVMRDRERFDEARQAWGAALHRAANPQDQEAIERWLQFLPG
jgi:tetratricopeptide (TPR) repeat protein